MTNIIQYHPNEVNEVDARLQASILRLSGFSKKDVTTLLKEKLLNTTQEELSSIIDEVFEYNFDQLCKNLNSGNYPTADFELFSDSKGNAYSRFMYKNNIVTDKITGGKFKHYLIKKIGKPVKKHELIALLDVLESEALMERPKYNLNYRVAKAGKTLYYDLGDQGIVKINRDGWTVLKQDLPIIFRRSPLFKNQIEPQHGGTIDLLFKYINIQDESEKILIVSFITSALVAEIQKPILALSGSPGSAKTTTQKLIANIIDPSLSQDSHIRDIRELLQEASQRYILPFDNLSYIKEADSDLLCKMVTGTTFSKRRLYTDEESVLFTPHNAIILNGISLPVNRSDLLSRCVIINLPRITDSERRDETSLISGFNADKPLILGAFFTLLSKALSLYDSVEIKQLPRMADYAKWGCATCKALGMNEQAFIDAYTKNTVIQHEESVYSSMLGQVIIDLLSTQNPIKESPTFLLKRIREHAKSCAQDLRYLPASPHAMGKELKRITPDFEAMGITIDQRRGKFREYIINKKEPKTEETKPKQEEKEPAEKTNNQHDITDNSDHSNNLLYELLKKAEKINNVARV
jgi:hypothetical protein